MPNVQKIINRHNKEVVSNNAMQQSVAVTQPVKTCNCRKNTVCPVDGNCLNESYIYQATVTRLDNGRVETYTGLTANTFKIRYNAHTCSFRNIGKRNETALSKHIWKLKESGVDHSLVWKLIEKRGSYTTATDTCNLCLTEKFYIIRKPVMATLNSSNALLSGCRHRAKFKLINN